MEVTTRSVELTEEEISELINALECALNEDLPLNYEVARRLLNKLT